MKLRRLELNENAYRSLSPFLEQQFPKNFDFSSEIDPICLVGLNGSGKSNLLALLSDIFYLLDTFLLEDCYKDSSTCYFAYANNRDKNEIYFMIEYEVKVNGKNEIVRIKREVPRRGKKSLPIFERRIDESNYEIIDQSKLELRNYLPKVIAYTSGTNELLSMPYIDMQDYYGRQITSNANNERLDEDVPAPKMMFLDYEVNSAIVVANYLLSSPEKLNIFQELLKIENLERFRIRITTNCVALSRPIILTKELRSTIDDLKDCSTYYEYSSDSKGYENWHLDYVLTPAVKEAFKNKFQTAKKLFEALYKLNRLNTLCIPSTHRKVIRSKRKEGILLKFPTVATLDKVFNISKVDMRLEKPHTNTEYMKISDGEHQLLHIVGGILLFDDLNADEDYLFLMDEPDTHLNPKWRTEFFKTLNDITDNKKIELILTTHSPYIVCDCHGYNVFQFVRDKNTAAVTFQRSHYETYGSDIHDILKELFTDTPNISSKAYDDLKEWRDRIEKITKQEDVDSLKHDIQAFGNSIDKLLALSELSDKAKQLNFFIG